MVEALNVGLGEWFVGEYLLHDVILVSLLDKATLDAEALVGEVFSHRVRDFFHPNALLSLFQVTSNFQIAVDGGQLAHEVLARWVFPQRLVQLAVQGLAIVLLYELSDELLLVVGA